jgi:hypothetical protein
MNEICERQSHFVLQRTIVHTTSLAEHIAPSEGLRLRFCENVFLDEESKMMHGRYCNRAFGTRLTAGSYPFVIPQLLIHKFFAQAKIIRAYRLSGMPHFNHKPHSIREKSRMGSCTLIPARGAYGRKTISPCVVF